MLFYKNKILLNFPESNEATAIITSYSVHKKIIGYYLIAELENEASFFNYKTNNWEKKKQIRIEGRGIYSFGKFYNKKYSSVYVCSIEDNIILDIADLTP